MCAPDHEVPSMAWLLLILAGLLEVGWTIGLKYTEGFTRLWPSVGTLPGMALFGEPATAARLLSLGLIVAGIVGLKLASPA
jgi:quaternary ammonium compound-resistance protein SugE